MSGNDHFSRLNQYRILWIFVYFDLPTQTAADRKAYSTFRKSIIQDGFGMIQYSIYARHCASRENADVHKRRVKSALPEKGEVIVFDITDRQFGMMEFFGAGKLREKPDTPQQLELF